MLHWFSLLWFRGGCWPPCLGPCEPRSHSLMKPVLVEVVVARAQEPQVPFGGRPTA